MAYRNFSEFPEYQGIASSWAATEDQTRSRVDDAEEAEAVAEPASLSALEWLVVSLARKDSIRTLRIPGRLAMALGSVFGGRTNPRLADPKLEALRRLSVLSWHRGHSIAPAEVRAFVAAGFTNDHYELILASIGVSHAARNTVRASRGMARASA